MDDEFPQSFRMSKAQLESRMRIIGEKLEQQSLKEEQSESNAEQSTQRSESAEALLPKQVKSKTSTWTFESVGGFFMPREQVNKLSLRRQEQLLVRDLIYAFSGVPSAHIRPEVDVEQLDAEQQLQQITFSIDPSFTAAFRALASELLPLVGYYISVQSFIDDSIMCQSSLRALGNALHKSLHEYFELLSTLENQLLQHKLNLQQLVAQLRPWLQTLQQYAALVRNVRHLELSTAELLTLVHEQLQQSKCQALLTDVARYYMKMVQLWTQKGVLYDMRKEFFVEDAQPGDMSSTLLSPKQCCHAYWAQRYSWQAERLPSFLQPQAEQIFLAGKYLNVLRQCNVQLQLLQESLSYEPATQAHVAIIQRSYELPAKKLLDVLVKQHDLPQHLRNIESYLFLQYKPFATELFELLAPQLWEQSDNMRIELLHLQVLEAMQHIVDPHKHLLQSELKSFDVSMQLQQLLEANSEAEGESQPDSPQAQLQLYGFESFALGYVPKWPISLLLHELPLQQLQILHRVLFFLRYVLLQLQAYFRQQPTALADIMSSCLQQIESHMLDNLLPRWQQLQQKVKQAQHIDEVLTHFQLTLDKTLRLCLLSEPVTFVRAIFTLGQLCLNFCKLQKKSMTQEYAEQFNNLLGGIIDLVAELVNMHSSVERDKDEAENCKQLLKRLESISLQCA
ncbi:gamma-tubulin complex component 2 homolog [Drosophila busckii]|uniref:gamma-tubulin complex component 2 homolog n=1 Tax=Drosophila busckii TaxID=30019 RepID=UPI00083E9B81|nr:gamma-tubulin complex component 2 homolog [Drosophila busckii]